MGWLMRDGAEELLDWLMRDGAEGRIWKPVLSARVHCGIGRVGCLCDGMLGLVGVNGHEARAFFLHSAIKLLYLDAVLSSKAACDFARGHLSARLQAPPVWYLVQHSQSRPLNVGTPRSVPLGNRVELRRRRS